MATRLYIPLTRKQREALLQYAEDQYRDPRIQALMFIEQGLIEVGALSAEDVRNQQRQLMPPNRGRDHGGE